MAYIGRQLARGENKLFDDISSSFNGSTTVFNLTVSSVATSTATAFQLFVSLGGVMQKPNTDFTTAGNQITFTTAPAAGLSCWIMMQGDTIDQAAIPDASVTPSKIAGSGDFAFPADVRLNDGDGSHYVGFQAPTTVSTNKIWTLPAADGSANQYLKTDGSGTLSWGSDSTSDPSKMPLAGGTFTGDVTFTGDASNGLWDKSASAFVANLTGNVTGNASGSAATVTGAAQSAITSLGTLTGLTVAGNATLNAQGDLRFADSDSSNWVAFQAPATIGSNVTWTLPAADGSANQLLTTNGSGTLSWSTVAGGLSSDAQKNTVGGTNAGNSFTGTDANDNTLIGYDAGTGITTGDKNTALGVRANEQGTTGSNNTAIGYEALRKLTDGGNNVCMGSYAGYELASGGRNVAVGALCLQESITGTGTVAMGWQASQENRGSYNVPIGYEALKGTGGVTGGNNVAIGSEAGKAVTSGDQNVMLGRLAGNGVTSGAHNVLLGAEAGTGNSPSGNVTTGNGIFCLGDAEITDLYCQDTSISSSDSRDKTDITNFTHGLSWINKLNPVTYRWDKRSWYNEYNEDGSLKTEVTRDGSKKKPRQHIGFLAQDVLAIEQADGFASKKDDMLVVNLNEDDTAYGLKYERLVPVLVNAVKELATKVAALEAA